MKERAAGKSQEQARPEGPRKANVKSRKTVGKYEKLGKVPSELKAPRRWRTRRDPFGEDWPVVEGMLAANSGLEAKTLPRLLGRSQQHINYRHLVESLLRKPAQRAPGFRHYRYQPALFPQLVFRQCWDQFTAWYGEHKADLSYLRILRLAAQEMEGEVATALTLLLEPGVRFDEGDVAALVQTKTAPVPPPLAPCTVDLRRYDALLQGGDA